MSALGVLGTAASFGSQFIGSAVSPIRYIGDIYPDVVVEEDAVDRITKTQHPIEQSNQQSGTITDHAYKEPARVTVRVGFSNSSLQAGNDPDYASDQYQALLDQLYALQPVDVQTGKRLYQNMLMVSVEQVTDETTERSLAATVILEEAIIVTTSTSPIPPLANQSQPQNTGVVQNQGAVQPQLTQIPGS